MDGRAVVSDFGQLAGAVVDVLKERMPGAKIPGEFKENLIRRLKAEAPESLVKSAYQDGSLGPCGRRTFGQEARGLGAWTTATRA